MTVTKPQTNSHKVPGAQKCQAKLGFKIKADDILDLSRGRSLVTKKKFREVWGDIIYWCYQGQAEVAIRQMRGSCSKSYEWCRPQG